MTSDDDNDNNASPGSKHTQRKRRDDACVGNKNNSEANSHSFRGLRRDVLCFPPVCNCAEDFDFPRGARAGSADTFPRAALVFIRPSFPPDLEIQKQTGGVRYQNLSHTLALCTHMHYCVHA